MNKHKRTRRNMKLHVLLTERGLTDEDAYKFICGLSEKKRDDILLKLQEAKSAKTDKPLGIKGLFL